jgi:flagellum-specific peptidoglycan hydrolase FlgJ
MNIIKKHWFKIVVVMFLGYLFLQKDFSFQFNINDKTPSTKQKAKEKYTETAANDEVEKMSFLDFFTHQQANRLDKFNAIDEATKVAFVKRFGKLARDEQAKFNLPASIILANAMLQSEVGTHFLATTHNNFFAMQCYQKEDNCVTFENERFLKYESAWESFRAHSTLLSQRIKTQNADYRAWLEGMQSQLGTDENYVAALRQIIERYHLYKIDE